jgi:hypothetical protein
MQLEHLFDRLHSPIHAGAVASRRGEQQLLDCIWHRGLLYGAAVAQTEIDTERR